MRCFIAVDLPPPLKAPLASLIRQFAPRSQGLRWCDESQLHVTLKFLGEVEPVQLSTIRPRLAEIAAGLPAFSLWLGALGCFPSPRAPRVLWCGLTDESNRLSRMAAAMEDCFAKLGFEPEHRPFAAHVTLARVKSLDGATSARAVLDSMPALPKAVAAIHHVTLFESRLTPTGARYTTIDRFAVRRPAP